MDKNKLTKQILIILYIILGFILFNISFYNLITKNYINNYGEGMKEKSIDIKSYLPFEEESLIVHETSDIKITENVPQMDGATALYPIYSAYVEVLYPKESVKYNGKDFLEDSKIQKTGTTVAYKKVIDGETDIIFCGKPSEKQLEYAESKKEKIISDYLEMLTLRICSAKGRSTGTRIWLLTADKLVKIEREYTTCKGYCAVRG